MEIKLLKIGFTGRNMGYSSVCRREKKVNFHCIPKWKGVCQV